MDLEGAIGTNLLSAYQSSKFHNISSSHPILNSIGLAHHSYTLLYPSCITVKLIFYKKGLIPAPTA